MEKLNPVFKLNCMDSNEVVQLFEIAVKEDDALNANLHTFLADDDMVTHRNRKRRLYRVVPRNGYARSKRTRSVHYIGGCCTVRLYVKSIILQDNADSFSV